MRYSSAIAAAVLVACPLLSFALEPGENLLKNPGAENGTAGWFEAKIPAAELSFRRDTNDVHTGKASFSIENHHDYAEETSNNWTQKLSKVPAGTRLIIGGWLRAKDAKAVNLCIQCWDADERNMLGFVSTEVLDGDSDWKEVASDPVRVPEGTQSVRVRAALTGKGKAWFDDLYVTVAPPEESPEQKKFAASQGVASDDAPGEDLMKKVDGKVVASIPVARDQMVLAYMPEWAHGRVDNIGVADNQGGVRTMFAWPKIDKQYADCRFILACYAREVQAGKEPGEIGAYEIQGKWDEKTPWSKQPTAAKSPAETFKFESGRGWKTFDVTKIISAQFTGSGDAQGVLLRFETEDRKPNDWSGYQFVSREGESQWKSKHPVLLVVRPKE
jgi:hypothetical protein